MKTYCPLLLSFSLFLVLAKTPVRADELLDQGLAKMAKEIKIFLDEEKRPPIILVGDFSGVPKLKSSGGIEISRAIKEQLVAVGITVKDDAVTQIMGRFKLSETKQHPNDQFDSLSLEIEATILDDNGDELAELPISVFGSVALQIAGVPAVELPQNLPESSRQEKLINQIKSPPTKLDDGKTKPTSTSPFAMEVLVVKGNQLEARKPQLENQMRAFIDLHKGEEYIVRLYNNADFEAAVSLSIDGVDMFVDATDAPTNSRVIVSPKKHVDVPGWYISRTKTKAFEIGGYEESVAKRVGNSTNVGMITAAFRACWNPNGPRPSDEPGGAPKGGKATKQGRDVEKSYQLVTKDFGDVRAVVSVRYDR